MKLCDDHLILGMIFDEISMNLGQLMAIDNRLFMSYHIFELYYTIYQLLELGITPFDIHAGNIGFVEIKNDLAYDICGCEFTMYV